MTKRRSLARTALTGLFVLIVLNIATRGVLALLHALPVLLIGAVIWAAYLHARHRLRLPKPSVFAAVVYRPDPRLAAVEAERDALRNEVARLRIELAAARESAEMAWDAAADRPPRPAPSNGDPDLSRRLAAPRSGVRPLYGGRDDQ